MIFVTVGTHNQPFDRLLIAMDQFAQYSKEDILIQTGCSTYLPRHAKFQNWFTGSEMLNHVLAAHVVVSHCAAGSAILALQNQKPLIVFPRLHQFGEHMDDHQLELATALQDAKMAVYLKDLSMHTIKSAVEQAPQLTPETSGAAQLIVNLKQQIFKWEKRTRLDQA